MQGTQQTLCRHGFTQVKRFPADTSQRRSWESHGFPLLLGREKPRVFPPAPKYCTWSGRADKPRVLQQKTSFSKNTDMTQTKVFQTPHFFLRCLQNTDIDGRFLEQGHQGVSPSLRWVADPHPSFPTPLQKPPKDLLSHCWLKNTQLSDNLHKMGRKNPSFMNYMPAIDCGY